MANQKRNYTWIGIVFFGILTMVFTYSLWVEIYTTWQRDNLMQRLKKEGIITQAWLEKVYQEIQSYQRKISGDTVYKVKLFFANIRFVANGKTIVVKKNLGTQSNYDFYKSREQRDSVKIVFLPQNPTQEIVFAKYLNEYQGADYFTNANLAYSLLSVLFLIATLVSAGYVKIPN
ncbi:MAG: hypothetical protein NZ551_11835 [Microscillaceae bacterium]|nr:hypothetical protein [Microscillaceae bacterium]MDW8461885.1 hypothetical protein [Cytophagales bacterium]